MSQYPVENIRTVALVGHGSTGKTTLMEALLYRNGVIKEVGTVEKGNTVGDFDPMEKEVKHSLRTTVAHLNAQKDDGTPVRIFLLDTPGYPDCVGQALGALDAVKTVCVVVDATKGIELMTRRMMHWAKERNLCRMIVVLRRVNETARFRTEFKAFAHPGCTGGKEFDARKRSRQFRCLRSRLNQLRPFLRNQGIPDFHVGIGFRIDSI